MRNQVVRLFLAALTWITLALMATATPTAAEASNAERSPRRGSRVSIDHEPSPLVRTPLGSGRHVPDHDRKIRGEACLSTLHCEGRFVAAPASGVAEMGLVGHNVAIVSNVTGHEAVSNS